MRPLTAAVVFCMAIGACARTPAEPALYAPSTIDRLIAEAVAQHDKLGDDERFRVECGLALVDALRGQKVASAQRFDELIARAKRPDDATARIRLLTATATYLGAAGEPVKARSLLDQARAEFGELNETDAFQKPLLATILCEAYSHLGDAAGAFAASGLVDDAAVELICLDVAGRTAADAADQAMMARIAERIRAAKCESYDEPRRIKAWTDANLVDEARAACEARTWQPDEEYQHCDCLTEIGKAYARLGNFDAARTQAEMILSTTSQSRQGAPVLFALCGDLPRAEAILGELTEGERRSALVATAYIAYRNKDFAARDRLLKRAVDSAPRNDNPAYRAQFVIIHATLGCFAEAAMEQATIQSAMAPGLGLLLAYEMLREGPSRNPSPFYPGERLLKLY